MEKFENLTVEQLNAKEAELSSNGFVQAQTIATVEPGNLDGKPEIISKGEKQSANFFIICYERKGEQKYFKGAYFDAKHLSNGKNYSHLTVGMDDQQKERFAKAENLGKSYDLKAESYTTSDNRKVTTVKLQ